MATIPLAIADPLAQQQQAQNLVTQRQGLTSLLNDQRLQQQQIQANQINLDDQKAMSAAMHAWDGQDINDLPSLMIKSGASAGAVMGMKKNILDLSKQQADVAFTQGNAGKVNLENQAQRHQNIADAMNNAVITNKDGSLNAASTSQALDSLGHNAEFMSNLQPSEAAQLPDLITHYKGVLASDPEDFQDQWGTAAKGHIGQSQQSKMALDQLDVLTKQQTTTNTAANIAARNAYITANPMTDGHPTTAADFDVHQAQEKARADEAGKLQADQDAMGGGMAISAVPLDIQEANDWIKKNPGKTLSDFLQWKTTIMPRFETSPAGGGTLSPAALDQAAEKYYQTGELPPMGMGASASITRRQIMDRSAVLHPEGALAANSAEFKANESSLEGLQKNFDQVTAFENTAGKNLDQFLTTAAKVVDSGSPWISEPLRSINKGMLGSADQAAFNAARATALTEISKVLNSSNASGVLSDSARQEVSQLIGPDASLKQIVSAANILKTDMANRHQAYQDQISDIQKRLGGKGSAATTGHIIDIGGKRYQYKGSGDTADLKSYNPL